jgi:uncharacterized protein (TIGR02466 family)
VIQNIFSISIGLFELKDVNNSEMITYANQTSNKNNYKENKDILKNKIFKKLNDIVEEKMNEYFATMYSKEYEIFADEAWSNVGDDKFINVPHIHNNSFISAVYYPLSTEGEIIFLNPAIAMVSKHQDNMINKHNEYTSSYFYYKVKTGDLLIFNSMLQHMVKCKNEERVSIAYNGCVRLKNKEELQHV